MRSAPVVWPLGVFLPELAMFGLLVVKILFNLLCRF